MAVDVAAAAAELVDLFTAAGVPACVDMRDIQTPGVFIPAPQLAYRFGRGADATWRVVAAVPATGRSQALTELSAVMAAANAALAGGITSAVPVDLASVDGAGALPGYELTFTTRIPETR